MLHKWVLMLFLMLGSNVVSLNKSMIYVCVQMAQLRSAETQLAQLLHERQMADKHNQALRTQMIKAQEKVRTPVRTVLHFMPRIEIRAENLLFPVSLLGPSIGFYTARADTAECSSEIGPTH